MNSLPLIRRLTFVVCAAVAPLSAKAQELPAAADTPEKPVCSVVTVAPGDSLDALFGHTAIRIKDRRLKRVLGADDVWFDYGVFDPSDWTFWIHYAKGDAKYMMIAADPQSRLDVYHGRGQGVVEQKLDLTAAEAQKLEDFLLDDLENGCGKKGYDYRFLDDNCTTRAKEAIRQAVGAHWRYASSAATYRTWSDIQMHTHPWARLGANLFMGNHADKVSHSSSQKNAADFVFLPVLLRYAVSDASPEGHWFSGPSDHLPSPTPHIPLSRDFPLDLGIIRGTGSRFIPLGRTSKTGVVSALSIPTTADWPLVVFSFITFSLALPTLLRWKKRKPLPSRGWPDALLFALVGAVGSLMAFLGVWSLHPELGAFNWNLIWCWPTHLLFAAGLILCPQSPRLRVYARVAAIGASGAALAYFFVPQALPVPLFPLALLLGLRAARWGWPPATVMRT